MPELLQPSFAAGELSPQSQGRVDLAKYRVGCKTLRNMLVLPQGGAWNRAGTGLVGQSYNSAVRARLIPFQFSTSQQYALEFSDHAMRVVKNGGVVQASGGGAYVLATPFAAEDLPLVRFTQSADTMTLVHPSYAPQQLTRTADNAWAIAPVTFGPSIAAPTGLTSSAVGYNSGNLSVGYDYSVSAISASGEESLPAAAPHVTNNPLTGTITNNLGWTAVSGAASYNVYKLLGSSFGFVGTTTGTTFIDANIQPDTAIGVQQSRTALDGQNPGTVEYHQQRLVFGDSTPSPETLWMSQSANPRNFNTSLPVVDSDAIKVTLATRQVNEVRNLVSLNALLVLTSGGEFLCEGNNAGVVTPSSVSMRPQSFIGCSQRPAILAGSDVLYESAAGTSVRNIRYDFNSNTYQSVDLSLLSSHLLVGFAIAEWCWSQEPDRVVWIVRNDGALLALTYMRDQDVYAWSRHDSPGGVFESCCTVNELGAGGIYFSVLYLVVNRSGVRCIERMAPRAFYEAAAGFLDSSITYSGAAATVISGFSHLNGTTVSANTVNGLFTGLVVAGGQVTLPVATTFAVIGVAYESDLETVSLEGVYFTTIQGHMKRIPRVTLRLSNTSLDAVLAGPDGAHLRSLSGQDDIPANSGYFTGDVKVNLDTDWGRQSSVLIRQSGPYPLTVLDVMPEIELGPDPQQAPPPLPPLVSSPGADGPRPTKVDLAPDAPPFVPPPKRLRPPAAPRVDAAAVGSMFKPRR